MVDSLDSGSSVQCGRAGSSPASRTKRKAGLIRGLLFLLVPASKGLEQSQYFLPVAENSIQFANWMQPLFSAPKAENATRIPHPPGFSQRSYSCAFFGMWSLPHPSPEEEGFGRNKFVGIFPFGKAADCGGYCGAKIIFKNFIFLLDIFKDSCIIYLVRRDLRARRIGDLCNGSTPDSDSVCGGSNPSSPAKK